MTVGYLDWQYQVLLLKLSWFDFYQLVTMLTDMLQFTVCGDQFLRIFYRFALSRADLEADYIWCVDAQKEQQ